MNVQLEQQLAELEAKKVALFDQGSVDQVEVSRLNARIKEVQAQINSSRQRDEAIEEKVQSEAVPFAVAGINLDGIPVEIITLMEAVVKADRRRIHTDSAMEKEQEDKQHAHEIAALEVQVIELQRTVKTKDEIIEFGTAANKSQMHEIGNYRDRIAELIRDNEDLTSKLSNAAAQIEESQKEIKQLKEWNDDLRKAQQFGEKESQGIIDVTPDEKNDIATALEEVKKLYTKTEDWGSRIQVFKPDGSFELVPRAEVEAEWEPITVPALADGGSNDSISFPGQDQTQPIENTVLDTAEVSSFRNEENPVLSGTGEDSVSGPVVSEQVSREEFEALKRRVDRLEGACKEAVA